MKFTGERVVIGDMWTHITTLQEHIARYNFALQPAETKTVLDAACGTGYGSKLLAEAALSVLGIDNSKETIDYASKLYPDIEFKVYDLDKEFPDQDFDCCISFETIEHLNNPEVFLENVSKHCMEFIFSIPINNASTWHKHVWSKEQIIEMIGKHWKNVFWYQQAGMHINQLDKGLYPAQFMIGSAIK